MTLPATNKPQALAARAYIKALQMHRDGLMTEADKNAVGEILNDTIKTFGKP